MNRALRYGVALAVGLSVTGLVARFGGGENPLVPWVFLVYAVTTSLVVSHRGTWRKLFSADSDRTRLVLSAVSSGVAWGVVSGFGQISLQAVTAAIGLVLFGMAITVDELDQQSKPTPD